MRNFILPLVIGLAVLPAASGLSAGSSPAVIDFNRDIRPIFSDTCYKCHGPDQSKRKGKLRLDTKEGAYADRGGYAAVTPGDLAKSEAWRRITAKNPDDLMPPADSGLKLTEDQIQALGKWIKQGAKYAEVWSFTKLVPPPVPKVKQTSWPKNGLDYFVLARLEKEKLHPSPEAEKATLIRRATLDLTGLPPTVAEVDAFLEDHSSNAYEKVVDRLLASSRYGEAMAQRWLDGARYADSNGYQGDYERYMWAWRDWVINAFNKNMPFDEFTIEQLAGDMLPNATLEQRVATGFNRNHRINTEGGIIAEEWRVETVIDRVETTSAVWMGLTMGCARCHDHKYDPISQKEFYQFGAIFNSVAESGTGEEKPVNHPPILKVPNPEQAARLKELDNDLAAAQKRTTEAEANLPAAQAQWEHEISGKPLAFYEPDDLTVLFAFDDTIDGMNATGEKVAAKLIGRDAPVMTTGRRGKALQLNGTNEWVEASVGNFEATASFSVGAWVQTSRGGVVISKLSQGLTNGYALSVEGRKAVFTFAGDMPGKVIRVESKADLPTNRWVHVVATYKGNRKAAGVKLYVDGQMTEVEAKMDGFSGTLSSTTPFEIGGRAGTNLFEGSLDDVRVYGHALSADETKKLALAPDLQITTIPMEQRTAEQKAALEKYFKTIAANEFNNAQSELATSRTARDAFEKKIPTTMVMAELDKPRDAFILIRGQYDKHGDKVQPGLPAFLPPLPAGAPMNRLGLAKWLVDPSHPLTARVTINRFWENFFGTGIVKTSENFGSQAEAPSNPELLDYLATEFIRQGWDMKAIQKMILMSATYRQNSRITPALLERDPENRLLARGPRLRLGAEAIRDSALAESGLLVEKLGGPSVRPYMPDGVWNDTSAFGSLRNYKPATDDGLYRRTMYTIWKRTAAPPTMLLFDSPTREVCTVKRSRSDTPLQALALLNEVTYVEASRKLAERMLTEGGPTAAERITFGFRCVLARPPTKNELQVLQQGLEKHLADYKADGESAKKLMTEGDSKPNPKLDVQEVAAYTLTASVLMNLDEAITKE